MIIMSRYLWCLFSFYRKESIKIKLKEIANHKVQEILETQAIENTCPSCKESFIERNLLVECPHCQKNFDVESNIK